MCDRENFSGAKEICNGMLHTPHSTPLGTTAYILIAVIIVQFILNIWLPVKNCAKNK